MKMKKCFGIFAIAVCGFLCGCSGEDDAVFADDTADVAPGVYSADLMFEAEAGKSSDHTTRGIDGMGNFTNEYPFNYIYVHSADNGQGVDHKVLKVPLKEVVFCDNCRGVHLEMEVKDGEGGYTITNSEGESITLTEGEEVYFSSYPRAYWHAEKMFESPVTSSDVFKQTEGVNEELLRSDTYSKDELAALLQQEAPQILLTRHCTGFRTTFMFTNVEYQGEHNYSVSENTWARYLPGTKPSDFYIKLYMGNNFCHDYDIFNDAVPEADMGGYYVTNQNQYQQFEYVAYSTSGATSDPALMYSYFGFGYGTETGNILIAPLNLNDNVGDIQDFSIYVFIKYAPDGNVNLNDDSNSMWLRVPIPDMTDLANRVHNLIVALDIHELQHIVDKTNEAQATTRSPWQAPMRMELKHPYKVIDVPGE